MQAISKLEIGAAVFMAAGVIGKAIYFLIIFVRHRKEVLHTMQTPLTESEVDEMNDYSF